MKFAKISFLVIFVAIVVIFVYCQQIPENLPPLTKHERKQAERYVKNLTDNHFILIEKFYNRAAQVQNPDVMFERIKTEYTKHINEVREFGVDVGETDPLTTAEQITEYLRGQWDAGHRTMRIEPVVSANLTFVEESSYDNPALPEEEDMHVEVSVEIHLLQKEPPDNQTITEEYDRYHRRLCDW